MHNAFIPNTPRGRISSNAYTRRICWQRLSDERSGMLANQIPRTGKLLSPATLRSRPVSCACAVSQFLAYALASLG